MTLELLELFERETGNFLRAGHSAAQDIDHDRPVKQEDKIKFNKMFEPLCNAKYL